MSARSPHFSGNFSLKLSHDVEVFRTRDLLLLCANARVRNVLTGNW